MSAPEPDASATRLDALRLLARLIADAWRDGGLPEPPKTSARKRSIPVEVILVPATRPWNPADEDP